LSLDDADPSWIMRYFDSLGDSSSLINLGIGEPDFDLFEPLKAEAVRAIREGLNKYTQTAGIQGLREAVARYYRDRWGADISPGQVIITPGASNALFMALAATIRQDDYVVIPTPSFPSFKALASMLGGRVVEVESAEEREFQPDVGALGSVLRTRGAAVIVNSPTNPTGAVFSDRTLGEIVDICRERGVYLISDEVYERFVYDGGHVSAAKYWGEYDRIIIVNSFSKTLAMTGWRLGYMVVPQQLMGKIFRLHAYINTCAPSVAQHVALYAMNSKEVQKMIEEKVAEYRSRRDILHSALNSRGIPTPLPKGGIYLFPRIPVQLDSETFCSRLVRDAEVVALPGRAFGKGGEGRFRLTLSAGPERLVEAADRISAMVERIGASRLTG